VSANGALYFVASASSCNGFGDVANTDLSSTIGPRSKTLAPRASLVFQLQFSNPTKAAIT